MSARAPIETRSSSGFAALIEMIDSEAQRALRAIIAVDLDIARRPALGPGGHVGIEHALPPARAGTRQRRGRAPVGVVVIEVAAGEGNRARERGKLVRMRPPAPRPRGLIACTRR